MELQIKWGSEYQTSFGSNGLNSKRGWVRNDPVFEYWTAQPFEYWNKWTPSCFLMYANHVIQGIRCVLSCIVFGHIWQILRV